MNEVGKIVSSQTISLEKTNDKFKDISDSIKSIQKAYDNLQIVIKT